MSLVSTEWLAQHLHDPEVRVCDVRWYLPNVGKNGATEYSNGHIPGAVFIDLDRDLAAPDDGTAGRHPLPTPEAFVEGMRRAGISSSTHVVAYDDLGGAIAARLWWLLRAHGHAKVSLLDGGLTKWKAENRPLETTAPRYQAGSFESRWNPEAAVSRETTRNALRSGAAVFDARARDRYRGDTEPVDPRAGHIPGAINAPVGESVTKQGTFLPREELQQRFESLVRPAQEVIASCGSGVTACHTLFALDWSGVRPFPSAKLYVGSFSDWSRRKDLPVATGSEPGSPA